MKINENNSIKENGNAASGGNLYVSNAFSFQMIDGSYVMKVEVIKKEIFDAMKEYAYSVMGHEDMANVHNLPYNRESIKLHKADQLLVAQIVGGRLPEGATVMPDDVEIEYKLATIY